MPLTDYGRGRSNTPKMHLGKSSSGMACGTAPASRDYVTTNKKLVDCKRCQARMVKEISNAMTAGMKQLREGR